MPTYLMTWNPESWEWPKDQTKQTANRVMAGERTEDQWSTGVTKKIEPRDRLLFIRLGAPPKGLFASGRAVSDVYQGEHYSQERAEQGDEANYVDFVYDEFIDPHVGPVLDQDLLADTFPEQHWSPQGSGSSIQEDIEVSLEELWQKHLHDTGAGDLKIMTALDEPRENIRTFDRRYKRRTGAPASPGFILSTLSMTPWWTCLLPPNGERFGE